MSAQQRNRDSGEPWGLDMWIAAIAHRAGELVEALRKIAELAERSDAHPDVQIARIARESLRALEAPSCPGGSEVTDRKCAGRIATYCDAHDAFWPSDRVVCDGLYRAGGS